MLHCMPHAGVSDEPQQQHLHSARTQTKSAEIKRPPKNKERARPFTLELITAKPPAQVTTTEPLLLEDHSSKSLEPLAEATPAQPAMRRDHHVEHPPAGRPVAMFDPPTPPWNGGRDTPRRPVSPARSRPSPLPPLFSRAVPRRCRGRSEFKTVCVKHLHQSTATRR